MLLLTYIEFSFLVDLNTKCYNLKYLSNLYIYEYKKEKLMKIKLQFYIISKNTIAVISYGVKLTNLDKLVQFQKTLITKYHEIQLPH